jgi:hypothetical protein
LDARFVSGVKPLFEDRKNFLGAKQGTKYMGVCAPISTRFSLYMYRTGPFHNGPWERIEENTKTVLLKGGSMSRIPANRVLGMLLLSAIGFPAEAQQGTSAASYSVIYTGRLFGYFRYPEVQSTADHGCEAPKIEQGKLAFQLAPEAQSFSDTISLLDANAIRVAVGDNFSPFLMSRKMFDTAAGNLVDKDRYEFDPNSGHWVELSAFLPPLPAYYDYLQGNGQIPADNVACFIKRMGFAALVPGIHDFYFGPERLREIARFLREDPPGRPEPQMLGANLYVKPSFVDYANGQIQGDSGSGSDPTQGNADGSANDPRAPSLVTPEVPLPWMRVITVRNAREAPPRTGRLPSTSDLMDGQQLKYKKICLIIKDPQVIKRTKPYSEADCTSEFLPRPDPTGAEVQYWLDGVKPIVPGQYVAFTVENDKYTPPLKSPTDSFPRPPALQQNLQVQAPFFENVSQNDVPLPYVLRETPAGMVAIFGVAGQDLIQGVGSLNSVYLVMKPGNTVDDHHEVDVQASDPADALNQVFHYCDADVSGCKKARKILLAQMPQDDAYQLAARLKIDKDSGPLDLIVAEADPDSATGDRDIARIRGLSGSPDQDREFNAPVVLVPGLHYDTRDAYEVRPRLQQAIVTPDRPSAVAPGAREKAVSNRVQVAPNTIHVNLSPGAGPGAPTYYSAVRSMFHAPPASGKTLLSYLQANPTSNDIMTKLGIPADPQQYEGVLRETALQVMQKACHADVAMIQERDVFFTADFREQIDYSLTNAGLVQMISAIFWKGDYIMCKSIPGSTINAMIKQSKLYRQQQTNKVAAELKSGWNLITLGANDKQDNDSSRLIDAQLVDPKRLYVVAMTDYLAGGDTGYAAMQGAEPPPAPRWSRLEMTLLSQAVANVILGLPSDAVYPARTYLDKWQGPVGAGGRGGAGAAGSTPAAGGPGAVPPFPGAPIPAGNLHPTLVFRNKTPVNGFQGWLQTLFSGDQMKKIDCNPQNGYGCEEVASQEKPVWSISLYKADFNYSFFRHTGTEESLGVRFPGVTSENLSAPESRSWAADYIARVQKEAKAYELYAQSSFNWGTKLQRGQKNGEEAYQPNQTADYWYQELGIGIRLWPSKYIYPKAPYQNPSGWKAVLAGGFQTQPLPPYLPPSLTSAGNTNPSPGSSALQGRRTLYGSLRTGFRYDFAYPKPQSPGSAQGGGSGSGGGGGQGQVQSQGQAQPQPQTQVSQTLNTYLEFGYQYGEVAHAISQLNFKSPTSPSLCNVAGAAGLACIDQVIGQVDTYLSEPAAQTTGVPAPGGLAGVVSDRDHRQDGLYFNFRFDAPVPFSPNVEMVLENHGEWFFGTPGDSFVDTRFDTDFKASLEIPLPILKQVTLAPTMELFFFENKLLKNLYFSYSAYASLNYHFDWHRGLGWRRALGYNSPVPTLPNLPSR